MTVLVDTSVVVKWFHEQGEAEVAPSRALLTAHREGRLSALVLDLAVYELGNVLLRPLGMSADATRHIVSTLLAICGPVVHPRPSWHSTAVDLAQQHQLTYYDASWASAARALGCPLVSADRKLLAAGLAMSPTTASTLLE